jgi:uncharacterized protein YndB with AHSA1/START domain
VIDVVEEINEVQRSVGVSGETRTVLIRRVYAATVDDVWDACTNPERIPRWFLPVSGELRVGGRYQLEGNAAGTIEECDPPHGFSATWEYGGSVSRIELALAREGDIGTRFELRHTVQADDHWERFGPGAIGVGWDLGLIGLGQHLLSGATVDPSEGLAWVASPDGRRFVALSSEAWRDAAVAAGADAAAASAAAERTTAAYTGAEESAAS